MNGRAHAMASYALAAPVGVATGLLARDLGAGILAAAGCAAGVLLSPDLDQVGITESEALVYRNGGTVLGHAWRTYWILYALVIPHRHWLSHAALIGTLGRMLYLLAPIIVVAGVQGKLDVLAIALWALWPMGVGLAASDVAHWVMDSA